MAKILSEATALIWVKNEIMLIYLTLFALVGCDAVILRKKPKLFVQTSFFLLFLVSALRKYTVGIDLAGHYASNYELISVIPWQQLPHIIGKQFVYYDPGWIVFMRALGIVSQDAQWFIIATSAIVCYSMGRYLLHHSENVYLETFLYLMTFTYFMYMNIIAQSVAIAVVLFSMDYLEQKKYLMFALFVALACALHSSAIVCFAFVPLYLLKRTRKNVKRFVLLAAVVFLGFDRILPIVVQYFFSQFSYYLQSEYGGIDAVRLMHLMFYVVCLAMGALARWKFKSRYVDDPRNKNIALKQPRVRRSLPFNFLFYITILSVMMRLLVYKLYIFSRMGYYFYPFACSFLVQAVYGVRSVRLTTQLKCVICGGMVLFFVILVNSLQTSYGVLPYAFFWQ